MITGTLINVVTVLIGGLVGTVLGNKLPEKMRTTVLQGLGLITMTIGISMAITTKNILIPLFSILIGGILGELLRIEDALERVGLWSEARLGGRFGGTESTFAEGFVTASLLFCVGPLAILGAIQDGLMGDYALLAVKSIMDMFAGMALAASLGVGVLLSAVTVFVYQGVISVAAALFGSALGGVTRTTPWVIELTATGGVVILSIAFMLLDIKRIRTANLLPAVFVAPAIVLVLGLLKVAF